MKQFILPQFMNDKSPATKILIVLSFFAIYFVWGTTYLAISFGLKGMEPFVLSALRYFIAGVLLLGWSLLRKHSFPEWPVIKVAAISGNMMLVGGTGLVVVAETYISSGYAAVVIATEPLWFLLLDSKRWKSYFSDPLIIVGLFIGFGGIALFAYVTPESAGTSDGKVYGTLLTLAGAILWVLGTLYNEKNKQKGHSHFLITGIQLAAAGIVSALIALFFGEWNEFHPREINAEAWGGLAFLIVMGSIVAYLAFTWLVTVQPPALVSTIRMLTLLLLYSSDGYWLLNKSTTFRLLL